MSIFNGIKMNISCRFCRHRHPGDMDCMEAKRLADAAAEERKRASERDIVFSVQAIQMSIEDFITSYKGRTSPETTELAEQAHNLISQLLEEVSE